MNFKQRLDEALDQVAPQGKSPQGDNPLYLQYASYFDEHLHHMDPNDSVDNVYSMVEMMVDNFVEEFGIQDGTPGLDTLVVDLIPMVGVH